MKSHGCILSIILCSLACIISCASTAPSDFVHTHLDELWGKTKEEIIKLIPEEHLTYADIKSSSMILHKVHNLDYGHGVMIPGLKETVTYYFHNSRLYRIIIDIESNEFTGPKQKEKLYKNYLHLIEEYTENLGPPDASSFTSADNADNSQSVIYCADISYTWNSHIERSVHALTSLVLEYSCYTEPIEIIHTREIYTHDHY
jgi:hypothetical protein